ncbi:hypothetical protein CHCC14819_1823 [Bacillus licheniformis]|nr:hypothetical protein CHCC15139_3813 [Bacillus licheniformis]TWM30384.1 hypothetical protein CHCC14819_1823 [Bacillus licheniformis]
MFQNSDSNIEKRYRDGLSVHPTAVIQETVSSVCLVFRFLYVQDFPSPFHREAA